MPRTVRELAPGVYAPLITPFKSGSEELDLTAWKVHVLRIAKAGLGLVVLGTNGEAVHLSDAERLQVIRAARQVLDESQLHVSMIVGTGTGSLKGTIELTRQAAEIGADAAIVIPPGYFAKALLANDKASLREFFISVADASPIPVLLYNFPGAAGGIDLDSDFLIDLAQHKNIIGVKLTCGSIGKGVRVITSPKLEGKSFTVFPGYSEAILPAIAGGHRGVITGTGNCFPLLIRKLWRLASFAVGAPLSESELAFVPSRYKDLDRSELLREVQKLQGLVSAADYSVVESGISGTKWYTGRFYDGKVDWSGLPRKPLPPASDAAKKRLEDALAEAFAAEKELEKEHGLTA